MKDQLTASGKMLSLGDRAMTVRHAFERQYMNAMDDYYPWVVDVYDDFIVVTVETLEYRQVGYTMTDEGVEFAPRDTWQPVEKEWAAKNVDTFIYPGGAIKALGDGKIGGYLVVFTDAEHPDLEGDFFTKETDFDFENGHQVGVYYQHGLDGTIKTRRMARGTLKLDDAGVWIEAQMELRDAYEEAIYGMVEAGKLGWSSGAASHLVERETVGKSRHITKWTIAEASLTPTPAEHRAVALPLKSLIHAGNPAANGGAETPAGGQSQEAQPEAAKTAGGAANGSPTPAAGLDVHDIPTEDMKMADQQTPQENAPELDMKSLGSKLDEVLKFIQDQPDLKRLGYTTDDGGTADPTHKSMGDYLIAVMRGDETRLKKVYGSVKSFPLGDGEQKALSTDTGSAGGYTVPTEYSTQLLQVASETSPIVSRVRRIPVMAQAGEYPALDNYTAPTAGSGNTAMAGGLTTAKRAEGGAYTETEPSFEMIKYRINDAASGTVKVSKELRADSIIGIEAFLRQVIGIAVGSKMEYFILRGNGVGEPLGILNAPALISVTPDSDNTFAYADAVEMTAHFKSVAGMPVWMHHRGLITDIAAFQVASSSPVVWASPLAGGQPSTLLGYPLLQSEHLPQANNSGCAVLADLGAYLLFEKGGLYVEFSEHANFNSGQDTWRFGNRMDGQPWMKSYVTLADPQGSYYESPFVKFDD